MKNIYTVKTNNGFINLYSRKEAMRIARIQKSDGWPTFVKKNGVVIFSFDRANVPGLV